MSLPPSLSHRHLALGAALALAWILNPYYGPSPIIVQAVIASAVALLWFLARPARPDPAAMLLACSWLAAAVFNAGAGRSEIGDIEEKLTPGSSQARRGGPAPAAGIELCQRQEPGKARAGMALAAPEAGEQTHWAMTWPA